MNRKNLITLVNNGYIFAPVTNLDGKSVPLISGFLEDNYDLQSVNDWVEGDKFDTANLALVAGKNNVVALDIDVDYSKLANQIGRYIIDKHPGILIRKCNNPRFAVIFRADETLMSRSNGCSNGYVIADSEIQNVQKIEYIGNRLITIFGKHRTTDKPYNWYRDISPMTVYADKLPVLSISDVENIFKFYHARVPAIFVQKSKSRFSLRAKSDMVEVTPKPFEALSNGRAYSDEEVDMLLEYADGTSREDWLTVGMGLHNMYHGSEEGLLKWDRWSSQFDGYVDLMDCRTQWRTFRVGGGVTMKTVEFNLPESARKEIFLNKKHEDGSNKLQQFLKDKVLIESEGVVGDLTENPGETLLKIQNFHMTYANLNIPMEVKNEKTGEVKTKMCKVSRLWLEHEQRKSVYGFTYVPVKDRIVSGYNKDLNKLYWNTYQPANVNVTNDTNKLQYFIDHVEYLFNGPGDKHWILSWLAAIIQQPTNRMRTAPFHVSTFHGTGRGSFARIMTRLLGQSNCDTTDIKSVVKEGSKTGFISDKLLCCIHETHVAGSRRWEANDRLRTILGDNFQNVDVKYGEQKAKNIFTRFFMSSNHIDGFGITENDSRIEVFVNRKPPKPNSYYLKLQQIIEDDDFINQVYTFLLNYEYDPKLLMNSRNSPAKQAVMRATHSPVTNAFFEFKSIVKATPYTTCLMNEFIDQYTKFMYPDSQIFSQNSKEIVFLEKEYVQDSNIFVIQAKPTKVKTFDSIDLKLKSIDDISRDVLLAKKKLVKYWELRHSNMEAHLDESN